MYIPFIFVIFSKQCNKSKYPTMVILYKNPETITMTPSPI